MCCYISETSLKKHDDNFVSIHSECTPGNDCTFWDYVKKKYQIKDVAGLHAYYDSIKDSAKVHSKHVGQYKKRNREASNQQQPRQQAANDTIFTSDITNATNVTDNNINNGASAAHQQQHLASTTLFKQESAAPTARTSPYSTATSLLQLKVRTTLPTHDEMKSVIATLIDQHVHCSQQDAVLHNNLQLALQWLEAITPNAFPSAVPLTPSTFSPTPSASTMASPLTDIMSTAASCTTAATTATTMLASADTADSTRSDVVIAAVEPSSFERDKSMLAEIEQQEQISQLNISSDVTSMGRSPTGEAAFHPAMVPATTSPATAPMSAAANGKI
jgi:hypothetical protein